MPPSPVRPKTRRLASHGEFRAEGRGKRPAERPRRAQCVAPRFFLLQHCHGPGRHVAGVGDQHIVAADVLIDADA